MPYFPEKSRQCIALIRLFRLPVTFDILYQLSRSTFEKRFSESTKEEYYQWLCKTIHAFNARIPCPSFEEWEKCTLRPYDYIASFQNEPPEIEQEYEPQQ